MKIGKWILSAKISKGERAAPGWNFLGFSLLSTLTGQDGKVFWVNIVSVSVGPFVASIFAKKVKR